MGQRERGDLPENRRGDGAPGGHLGLVNNDRHQQLWPLGGCEPTKEATYWLSEFVPFTTFWAVPVFPART